MLLPFKTISLLFILVLINCFEKTAAITTRYSACLNTNYLAFDSLPKTNLNTSQKEKNKISVNGYREESDIFYCPLGNFPFQSSDTFVCYHKGILISLLKTKYKRHYYNWLNDTVRVIRDNEFNEFGRIVYDTIRLQDAIKSRNCKRSKLKTDKRELDLVKTDSVVIDGNVIYEQRKTPFNYPFRVDLFFQDSDTLKIISKGNIKKYYKPQYKLQKWGWINDSVRVIKNGTIPFTLDTVK